MNLQTLIEYMKLHLISLQQDSEKLGIEMENPAIDMNTWEYQQLEIQDIGLTGQMFAVQHIIDVAEGKGE